MTRITEELDFFKSQNEFSQKAARVDRRGRSLQRGGVRFFSGEGGKGARFFCFFGARLSGDDERARGGDRTFGGDRALAAAGGGDGGDLRRGWSAPPP